MQPTSLPCDVIIVNYNAGKHLSGCIASLISQAVEKIIIVDNASTDDSLNLLDQTYSNEPRLKIIKNSDNLGFGAACNIGIQASNQPFMLFLNPDCLLPENSLNRLLEVLAQNSEIGMVGGLLCNPDGTEQRGGRRLIPTPWLTLVNVCKLTFLGAYFPNLFKNFNLHKQPLPGQPIEIEAISGACMLVKQQAVDAVGGFDEGYFLHCEDLDWCMRFWQKNWKILFVPDAKVIHDQGTCSRSRPIFVEWHKHKGMMRFYRKFFRSQYPGPLMWLVSLGIWSRFGLLAVYYFFRNLVNKG